MDKKDVSVCSVFVVVVFVDFVNEVALVEGAVHDEILCCVVGEHDGGSAEVGLDLVELQEAEQVV